MKYIYKLFLFSFVLFFLFSACNRNIHKIEENYLTEKISELEINDTIKWIIILPGLGCNGCIQETESFMKEHIRRKEFLFVLTRISSLKILQHKIGIKVKDCPNIFIDKENIFEIPSDNNIYPCILQIRNGVLQAHEFQSPANPYAMHKLEKCILSKEQEEI